MRKAWRTITLPDGTKKAMKVTICPPKSACAPPLHPRNRPFGTRRFKKRHEEVSEAT
jgi:hypothetical protein